MNESSSVSPRCAPGASRKAASKVGDSRRSWAAWRMLAPRDPVAESSSIESRWKGRASRRRAAVVGGDQVVRPGARAMLLRLRFEHDQRIAELCVCIGAQESPGRAIGQAAVRSCRRQRARCGDRLAAAAGGARSRRAVRGGSSECPHVSAGSTGRISGIYCACFCWVQGRGYHGSPVRFWDRMIVA